MKGWRPSAIPKGSKPVRALLRTNSCRTSDRSACLLSLGPRAFGPWTPGSPFGQRGSAADGSDGNGVQASATTKTAPALRLLHETGGPETKPKETHEPMRTGLADAARSLLQGEKGCRKEKRALGGRRKCLKRPDSAKESKAFSLLNFGRALLDEARIWLNWVWLARLARRSEGARRSLDRRPSASY
jgi:hypothetical protein